MERKGTEQRKFGIKSQFPGYEPFIPRERLRVIYRVAETVAGQDKSKYEANKTLLDQLISETSELDLLFNHAKDFLRGDSAARYRLIGLLNHIIKREGIQGEPPSETKLGRPIEGPGASKGSKPHALDSSMLVPASSTGGQPCLVPPLRVADVFAALLRICAEDPRVGGGGGICPDYLMVVGNLVEDLNDLEVLYAAATSFAKGKDSKAFSYFEATLDIMRHSRSKGFRTESRLFPFIFGNSDAIPIALAHPRLFTDPCPAEKYAEASDVVECLRELMGGPRYGIQDIINITPDHERVSRIGCHGDEIEIQGSNLEVLREIVFPGRIRVAESEYTMLADERIRLIIPEGAQSGDISICIDPGIAACTRFNQCRLAEPGTDHYFEVVSPPTATLLVNGQSEDVEIEACTTLDLWIDAENVERAIIRNSRSEDIYDSGPRDLEHLQHHHSIRNLRPPDQGMARYTETYTLEVTNLCGTAMDSVEVVVYLALHLSVPRRRLDTGDSASIIVRVSCPIDGNESLRVRLDNSGPDNVRVPEEIEIPLGSTELAVEAMAESPGLARITARSDRYEEDSITLEVLPVITLLIPEEHYLHKRITIQGRGFQEDTFVRFNGTAIDVEAEVMDTITLTVEVPDDADDGDVHVVVKEDGSEYESNGWHFAVLNPQLIRLEPPAQVRLGVVTFIGQGFSTNATNDEIEYQADNGSRPRVAADSADAESVDWTVPPGTGAITGPVRIFARDRPTNFRDFRLLREEGEFYEVRTVIEDELPDLQIVITCGENKEVHIDRIGVNDFVATFYVDDRQMGAEYSFNRHRYGDTLPLVGGAKISERHCSVGVVVDGAPGMDEIRVDLVNADTGVVLFSNFYPKRSGNNPVEPQIWFSQDDTVAMIVAVDPIVGGVLKMQAHFIDIISGLTIEEVLHFRGTGPDNFQVPSYSARIENDGDRSQIVFVSEDAEEQRFDIP